jgi:FkbM family methyltransferase
MLDVRELAKLPRPEGEAQIRALCRSQYLGNHRLLGRCLGRYKMFLDGRDVGFAPHILLDGFWEYWITQFVIATVGPGMTVLDVGANFGYYSLLLADLVGPGGKVLAVEPNPDVAACLRDTLSINGFGGYARVEEAALGRGAEGEAHFFIPEQEPKNARVVRSGAAVGGPGRRITVRATNVDALTADLDRLDFIKIDAEGGEADILEGMTGALARLKPALLVEFNARRDYDAAALLARLTQLFPNVAYIDTDAKQKIADPQEILSRNVGEDWMLYCSQGPSALRGIYDRFFVKPRGRPA